MARDSHEVFISYASQNREIADTIQRELEGAGIPCWIAPRDIRDGQDWSSAIPPAIDASRLFLLVLSGDASASLQVAREVHLAQDARKRVLVFRVDSREPEGALRYLLAGLHRIDARDEPPDAKVGDVLESVRQFLLDRPSGEPDTGQDGNVPNNLPEYANAFVGRNTEERALAELLHDNRIVTIVGPGGVGKTRTSVAVARRVMREFPGGVWFCELAPLDAADSAGEEIKRFEKQCGDAKALLIIDNCEHVRAVVATALDRMMTEHGAARVLCTSREPIGAMHERTYRLDALAIPRTHAGEIPSVDELNASPAARLFLDRVGERTRASLHVASERRAIVEICRQLDGLPLALELAAARASALSFEQIASAVDERFRLLTKGNPQALPRQQTLRALIDWSFALLTTEDRSLFTLLGAFSGRFSLGDAAAIVGDRVDRFVLLDAIDTLIEKSLVVRGEVVAGEMRYELLESMRAFARDVLGPEQTTALVSKIARYVAQAIPELVARPDSIAAINAEIENVHAALTWFVGERNDVLAGATLLVALDPYWLATGRWAEGKRWCEAALELLTPEGDRVRARLLLVIATLAMYREEFDRALECYEAALPRLTGSEDRLLYVRALSNSASARFERGEVEAAEGLWHEALDLCRQIGDDRTSAMLVGNLGMVAWQARLAFDEALERYGQSLEMLRRSGTTAGVALVLGNIAEVLYARGDVQRALEPAQESLRLFRELGNESYVADRLLLLAKYELELEHPETSALLVRDAILTFVRLGQSAEIAEAALVAARLIEASAQIGVAAKLHAFGTALRKNATRSPLAADANRWNALAERLAAQLPPKELYALQAAGKMLTIEQASSMVVAALDSLLARV